MAFFQDPPRLGNQYDDDALLREHLARTLPEDTLRAIEPELRHLGDLGGGRLYEMQLADRLNEPVLTTMEPWGRRVDSVELTPLWKEARVLTAEHGLVALAYERKHGALSRVHQFAAVYLVDASWDVWSCPLAMTDGAARTLIAHDNRPLMERALPRLLSRDPKTMWTSGQWMTERTGGSDVGLSETVARRDANTWRLYGNKYYTSAVFSEMALTLGRPEGNGPGGRGLALFYVELKDADGRENGITVQRLKDKLGTRKLPTAELDLDGAIATPVIGLSNGVRAITPMLNITRTWNSVGAVSGMRRATALAKDFARRRVAFGAPLSDKPLHADTLAGIEAEFEGAFLLTWRIIELLGRQESGVATESERLLSRVLTPITKLTTGKQAVAVASEAVESFGGHGYMEDTGIARLLRDAQVLPIWEGTTNVLSLDTLRALGGAGVAQALEGELSRALSTVRDPSLRPCVETARAAFDHAKSWMLETLGKPAALEAGARRFALTVGRAFELGLLASHAQWAQDHDKGPRAAAAARRFRANGVDLITIVDADDSGLLS